MLRKYPNYNLSDQVASVNSNIPIIFVVFFFHLKTKTNSMSSETIDSAEPRFEKANSPGMDDIIRKYKVYIHFLCKFEIFH